MTNVVVPPPPTVTPEITENVVVVPVTPTSRIVVAPPTPNNVVVTSPPTIKVSSVGIQGPAGISGANGGAYVHNQGLSSDTWTVNHNLGYRPAVTVLDSSGDQVEGSITYDSADTLTLTFSAPFSGTAYLS